MVGDVGAGDSVLGGSLDAVAVEPIGERAAELEVTEAFVPGEVGDLCLPWNADRGVGEGTKAEGEASSDTGGGDGPGRRWRRNNDSLLDAGALPGGHEVGKAGGVCEEGEDAFDRVGEPLIGLEDVTHDVTYPDGTGELS